MQPAHSSFLLLLLAVAMVNGAESAFTESFAPVNPADIDSPVVQPGLWQQVGWLKAGGRGPSNVKYAMFLDSKKPTAETLVLQWDKSSNMLDFFYSVDCWYEGDDNGVLKVQFSPDGKTWETVWSATSGKMPQSGYEVMRVKLPVSKSQPKFAIKWEYSYRAAFVGCNGVFLDDITFPAVLPAVSDPSSSPLPVPVPVPVPVPPSSPSPPNGTTCVRPPCLTQSDIIALAVGISIPGLALIVAICAWLRPC